MSKLKFQLLLCGSDEDQEAIQLIMGILPGCVNQGVVIDLEHPVLYHGWLKIEGVSEIREFTDAWTKRWANNLTLQLDTNYEEIFNIRRYAMDDLTKASKLSFKFDPLITIPTLFFDLATRQGFSIFKPRLSFEVESQREEVDELDGTTHITESTTSPPRLEKYDGLPNIPKHSEYKGSFLIQNDKEAYLLELSTREIIGYYPGEDWYVFSISITKVPRLELDREKEQVWLKEVNKLRARATYESFSRAQIIGSGVRIEIDRDDIEVTLSSDDKIFSIYLDILIQFLSRK